MLFGAQQRASQACYVMGSVVQTSYETEEGAFLTHRDQTFTRVDSGLQSSLISLLFIPFVMLTQSRVEPHPCLCRSHSRVGGLWQPTFLEHLLCARAWPGLRLQ